MEAAVLASGLPGEAKAIVYVVGLPHVAVDVSVPTWTTDAAVGTTHVVEGNIVGNIKAPSMVSSGSPRYLRPTPTIPADNPIPATPSEEPTSATSARAVPAVASPVSADTTMAPNCNAAVDKPTTGLVVESNPSIVMPPAAMGNPAIAVTATGTPAGDTAKANGSIGPSTT